MIRTKTTTPADTVVCPDCAARVSRERVVVQSFPPYGSFGECPRCTVGSPIESWRTAPTSNLRP